jgi:hypothetical protein
MPPSQKEPCDTTRHQLKQYAILLLDRLPHISGKEQCWGGKKDVWGKGARGGCERIVEEQIWAMI